mmetsp:Transcript_32225/g.80257  ORF Transcript_32225/g.80257 Transcript_32225/m.80257 type:complete len:240 (-) Transcript_32225:26-745(-)
MYINEWVQMVQMSASASMDVRTNPESSFVNASGSCQHTNTNCEQGREGSTSERSDGHGNVFKGDEVVWHEDGHFHGHDRDEPVLKGQERRLVPTTSKNGQPIQVRGVRKRCPAQVVSRRLAQDDVRRHTRAVMLLEHTQPQRATHPRDETSHGGHRQRMLRYNAMLHALPDEVCRPSQHAGLRGSHQHEVILAQLAVRHAELAQPKGRHPSCFEGHCGKADALHERRANQNEYHSAHFP